MIAYVLIDFVSCVNQFPASISCNLIFSVSLGLRKIQLFDLADSAWNVGCNRIESDRTTNDTDEAKNILNCSILPF